MAGTLVLSTRIWLFLALACGLFLHAVEGCHASPSDCEEEEDDFFDDDSGRLYREDCEEEHGHRRRRDAEAHTDTEEFMAACMKKKMPKDSKKFMPTLVDFVMHHTIWYARTDSYHCKMDTVDCWMSLCGYFLKWESMYMKPTKTCIADYGMSKDRMVKADTEWSVPKIEILPDKAIQVDAEVFMRYLRRYLPTESVYNVSNFDWNNLVEFYKNDYICSADFCNCSGLVLPMTEKCGQSWLSRLVGSTTSISELREPLLTAANAAINFANRKRSWKYILQRLIYLECSRRNNGNGCDWLYTKA